MKINYIAPCRTKFPSMAASSIHMMKMCEAYSKLGHDICLIASSNGYTTDELLEAYGIQYPFSIYLIDIPNNKSGNIIYAAKAAYYSRRQNPDIVIGRSVTSLSALCLSQQKVSIDLHGPVWEFNKLDYFLFKSILGKKHLHKITVNSQALKDMYIEHGLYGSQDIVVAHNGSDTSVNKISKTSFFAEDKINIGYFGSLYKGRGVELIIKLAEYFEELDFHLFGGSQSEVSEWQKEIGDTKNIYFHGNIPHAKVAYYRNQCDVLLAPYSANNVAVAGGKGDSSRYMNPIKIVEYMSSGKAIVTSNLSVLKELLGEDGAVFCDPDDIEQWVAAIDALRNKKVREGYGKVVLDKFNKGLTWEARAQKLL